MSKTFCSLAWKHLFLFPDGTAKLCCWAEGSINDNGQPVSINDHPLEEVWNSPYMREVRRRMVAGEPVRECELCYREEERLNWSYRTASNNQWLTAFGLNEEDEKEKARQNDYIASDNPIFVQLNLGNLCNLKCRMCNSTFSSQIERDPAHSKWAPPQYSDRDSVVRITEDNGKNTVAEQHPGLQHSGLHELEDHRKRRLQWTSGNACLKIPVTPETPVTQVRVKLWEYHPPYYPLKVVINNKVVYQGRLGFGAWNRSFRIEDVAPVNGALELEIESGTFRAPGDSRTLGVAIEEITLFKEPLFRVAPREEHSIVAGSRFAHGEPWYDSDEFLFGELLRNLQSIRELYFTGGEPLLNPKVEKIIDRLIEGGCTEQARLQFNSNCTKITDEFVGKLGKFRNVKFSLSLDGSGAVYEYIRYPGRWSVVSDNVRKLIALKNAQLTAVPILQIYNALNIVDLCRFCDGLGISFALMPLWGPSHLHVGVMPREARELAASRLRAYAETDCRPENVPNVRTAIEFIDTQPDMCTPETLRTFMLFTNDLDAGRRQDFRATHRELLEIIERTGFKWTAETLHAPVSVEIGA